VFRLVVTTLLVFGLIGAASYFVLKQYVGGSVTTVPHIRGLSADAALKKMAESNLYLQLERREFSDAVARGSIVSQFPVAGVKVKERTPVRVVLSDGPVRVAVPRLIGAPQIGAGVTVRSVPDADLDVADTAECYSADVKKGIVVAQDPPPGASIQRGGKIKLLVSKGPPPVEYYMPDLRNSTIEEARAALAPMGATIAEVREMNHARAQRGAVLAHQPGPRERIARGATMSVTIATGLEPSSPPPPRPE